MEDSELLKITNFGGYLYQLKIIDEIENNLGLRDSRVICYEHKWLNKFNLQEGFIDIIISIGTNGKMIIECKRVRDTQWIFLTKKESQQTMNARILWSKKYKDDGVGMAWDEYRLFPVSLESEFCIINKKDDKQRLMLENISSLVLSSCEAVAQEEINLNSNKSINFYFPAIITNAKLYVCEYAIDDINLNNGELVKGVFQEVPFIRFTKSLPTALNSTITPKNINESARENLRTIFIINGEKLVDTLSKQWETKTPANGGAWPWDRYNGIKYVKR